MSDCLVIGGGVVGMMSARFLALSGAQVTLLDQRECGKESSWAGGGIVSPLYPWQYDDLTNELSFESQALYKHLSKELFESSGIDPEYLHSGLLMIDQFDTPQAKAWMQRYQVDYQTHEKGALFSKIASIRNPRLLQALKADIINQGVKVVENTSVQEFIVKDKKLLGVRTEAKDFFADNVVLCAGAWSSQLYQLSETVFPMKGQMIIFKPSQVKLKPIILDQGRYIVPRADGKILAGSTMEDVGFDRTLDEDTKQSLYDFACEHLPMLEGVEIEKQWSGFRPATRSSGVIIGRDDQYQNLFINTGHFRNGINMAPASAIRITSLINE